MKQKLGIFLSVLMFGVIALAIYDGRQSAIRAQNEGIETIGIVKQYHQSYKRGDKVTIAFFVEDDILIEKRQNVVDVNAYPIGAFVKLKYLKIDWRNGYSMVMPEDAVMRDIRLVQQYLYSIDMSMDVLEKLSDQL